MFIYANLHFEKFQNIDKIRKVIINCKINFKIL